MNSFPLEPFEGLRLLYQPDIIVDHLVDRLEGVMTGWRKSHSANCSGGKMRGDRGEDIETFVRDAIAMIREVTGKDIIAKKGSTDQKDLVLIIDGQPIRKQHQVDVHLYVEGAFRCVIECKAYLDSCYYVRACDDFRLFRRFDFPLTHYIVALENSIDSDTRRFHDHVTDHICHDVFFLLDGKRSSSKPVYDDRFPKKTNRTKMTQFVDALIAL